MLKFLRRRALVPVALLVALDACAVPTGSVLDTLALAAEPAAEPAGPALWRVADADTTIYLFGTVHALPKDVPWMRGPISEALAKSDTLVTEIDMRSAQDPATMQGLIMKTAVLPEGQTLRGLLDDAQRTQFDAAMTKLGLPVAAFDRFEPWYASLMFALIPLSKAGVVGENGVEKALETSAGPDKTRGALETVEYQLSVFDTLPQDAQIDYMMKTIEGADDIKALLDKMVAEWLEGDADALAALMNEDMAADPALMETLLYQRNRTWADWVAKRLDTPGTVFMAVGAGHLAGAKSVQTDLAARGLTVSRVQ
jgi:uncharacterized protein YbaP (TraB family)